MAGQFITSYAYINGKWKDVGETYPVTNPSNNEVIGNAANCNKEITIESIENAKKALVSWRKTTAKARADILKKWHTLMMENKTALAELLTLENGKPINESKGEIVYAANFVEWLAEEAKRTYGANIPSPIGSRRMMTIKQPIGVCGMITPWNFPSAMITRKACAAIAAGCTVVLKPAEDTPFSALALAKIAEQAGLPAGVLNILPCARSNAPEIGQTLCTHPTIQAVSFTGSTAVGKVLLQQSASTVKKVSLELGGLAPFIVFDTADIDAAVNGAMASKFRYCGQTCVCANRFIVQSGVYDKFVEAFAKKIQGLKIGDGMIPENSVGPMINEKAVQKVEKQVSFHTNT